MNSMQSTKKDNNKLWAATKKDPMDTVSNLPHSAANCFLVFLLLHELWTTGLWLDLEASVHRTVSPSFRSGNLSLGLAEGHIYSHRLHHQEQATMVRQRRLTKPKFFPILGNEESGTKAVYR